MTNSRWKCGNSDRLYFLGLQDSDWSHRIKRCLFCGKKAMTKKKKCRDITLLTKVCIVKELDHKEDWEPNNWCFWMVVLGKTLESPLESKEMKPVNPKGNKPWIFIGRTDAEAEAPILLPLDSKNWLLGKDPDAGKDWRQEEEGMTEDEMVR